MKSVFALALLLTIGTAPAAYAAPAKAEKAAKDKNAAERTRLESELADVDKKLVSVEGQITSINARIQHAKATGGDAMVPPIQAELSAQEGQKAGLQFKKKQLTTQLSELK